MVNGSSTCWLPEAVGTVNLIVPSPIPRSELQLSPLPARPYRPSVPKVPTPAGCSPLTAPSQLIVPVSPPDVNVPLFGVRDSPGERAASTSKRQGVPPSWLWAGRAKPPTLRTAAKRAVNPHRRRFITGTVAVHQRELLPGR